MAKNVDNLDSPARAQGDQEPEAAPLTDKQEAMISYLEKSMGVISTACNYANISRQTHYNWLTNPTYKARVEEVEQYAIDFVESQMYKQIKAGDGQMIRYYLSRKAKQRGYIDSKDVTTGGEKLTGPEKIVYNILVGDVDDENTDDE